MISGGKIVILFTAILALIYFCGLFFFFSNVEVQSKAPQNLVTSMAKFKLSKNSDLILNAMNVNRLEKNDNNSNSNSNSNNNKPPSKKVNKNNSNNDNDSSASQQNSNNNNKKNPNNTNHEFQVALKSGKKTITIPEGIWPVPILKTQMGTDQWEEIVHPADDSVTLQVPKLWSLPVHNNELMTREMAMKIGTCIEPDKRTGSYVRGDRCPVDKRTIFVAIASYRDYQCRETVESIFHRAKHPERVRVAVVDQIRVGEDVACDEPPMLCEDEPDQALCKWKNQVDVYTVKAEYSCGPVFARHIGHRQYRGEYYATQSDAHVTYTQDWDTDIISQMEATHNDMAVLSTYLTDVQGSIDERTGESKRKTRPIMCNTYYEGGQGKHLRHGSQPEGRPFIHGMPQLQPYWAAGYSFSRGHFVVNVPYDPLQPMIFQGEEMGIGIRGFTIGYDYYAPERSVCFHHYAELHPKRNKVKHFWENSKKYTGSGIKGMKRLLGIVHMNPEVPKTEWDHTQEDIYGIGMVRTPEQFYKIFGIDVINKEVQYHLCKFVDKGMGAKNNMHNMFTPNLRNDGIGINYHNIHYEFVDPTPDEKRHT